MRGCEVRSWRQTSGSRSPRRTQRVAHRPRALHQSKRLAPVAGRPCFGDQGGARGPLSAHAEPQKHAAEHQLRSRLREAAQRRGDGIDQHTVDERADAAKPVGKPAEADTAECSGNQCGRHHSPTKRGGEMHLTLHLAKHHRVQHHVHAVEHVAQKCSQERAPLLARGLGQPTVNRVQLRSSRLRPTRIANHKP
jgi:hypothetical protein